ncbi:MAG: response regulator transcription factor [Actinomycetota bacterium]|nr:response regulator transcription factor [Actinomycetota bacterium]
MQRIMIVEDHTAFRQTLALVLGGEPEFEVVAQAGTLAEAREVSKDLEQSPDVGVVDLMLPDGVGGDVIRDLRAANPDFAALVLTASLDREEHALAVEAGASGVLHKSADVNEIIEAVRRLARGEVLFSTSELVELLRLAGHTREQEREARANIKKLTTRELEVLQALAEGLSNKEIAERLYVSLDTERTHMMNILNKLGVHSRLQALLFALRYGLVDLR